MRRPRPESPPPELLKPLVLAAHAIWLDRLNRDGWRLGELYDEDLKITPHLVPFEQLPAYERDHIVDRGCWDDVAAECCHNIEFSLRRVGEELRADELEIGMR